MATGQVCQSTRKTSSFFFPVDGHCTRHACHRRVSSKGPVIVHQNAKPFDGNTIRVDGLRHGDIRTRSDRRWRPCISAIDRRRASPTRRRTRQEHGCSCWSNLISAVPAKWLPQPNHAAWPATDRPVIADQPGRAGMGRHLSPGQMHAKCTRRPLLVEELAHRSGKALIVARTCTRRCMSVVFDHLKAHGWRQIPGSAPIPMPDLYGGTLAKVATLRR
jgi:hypothetical protein